MLADNSDSILENFINEQSDEQIDLACRYYHPEINRFLLTQFAGHLWRVSKSQNAQNAQQQPNEHEFMDQFFNNCNNINSAFTMYQNNSFFEAICDDVLIHILSFVSNDDILIHKSLILLNKQFNNVIKNNYDRFDYSANMKQWLLKRNDTLNMLGKRVDCRLFDGYWISNVYFSNKFSLNNDNKTIEFECYGLPQIQLQNKFIPSKYTPVTIPLKFLDDNNNARATRYAKYGSMTKRPILKHSNGIKSLINNNLYSFVSSQCVDIKITSILYLYSKDGTHRKVFESFLRKKSKNEWICGIIKKDEAIASNGQICILIDLKNDENYFGNMAIEDYYKRMEYSVFEQNEYYGIDPCTIATKSEETGRHNTQNQEYLYEYWVHIDDNEQILPFGIKSSQLRQQKMRRLLYSMYRYWDYGFAGLNTIVKVLKTKPKSKQKNNKMVKNNEKQKNEQEYQFELLSYNGEYIYDELIPVSYNKNNDDSKYKKRRLDSEMIEIDTIEYIDDSDDNESSKSVIMNDFKNIEITIKHKYCDDIDNTEMIKTLGFITQRPIITFNYKKLFENDSIYNKENDWKLLIFVKPKYLFIKNPRWVEIIKNSNDKNDDNNSIKCQNKNSSNKPIDIYENGGAKWLQLGKFEDMNWCNGYILSIWENYNDANKEMLKEKFDEWKGQCKVRIDITKEFNKAFKFSKHEIKWIENEMTEFTVFKRNGSVNDQIYFDYFVHLDDASQVKAVHL